MNNSSRSVSCQSICPESVHIDLTGSVNYFVVKYDFFSFLMVEVSQLAIKIIVFFHFYSESIHNEP